MTNIVTDNPYSIQPVFRPRYRSHLKDIITRRAEETHLYPNLSPWGPRVNETERLTVTGATALSLEQFQRVTKLSLHVCVRAHWRVYLLGDLEVLRVEEREALRELQQLPWRCELLLGVSPGDLKDDTR